MPQPGSDELPQCDPSALPQPESNGLPQCDPDALPQPDELHWAVRQPDSKLHQAGFAALHHSSNALHHPDGSLPLAEAGNLPQPGPNLPQPGSSADSDSNSNSDPHSDSDNVPHAVHHPGNVPLVRRPDHEALRVPDPVNLRLAGHDALHHNLPQPDSGHLAKSQPERKPILVKIQNLGRLISAG